jgi:hypothetical protein
MMTKWICPRCGYKWKSDCSICDVCTEIGYEITSQDVLDDMEIISIDEALEEIEGKCDEDEDNHWNY